MHTASGVRKTINKEDRTIEDKRDVYDEWRYQSQCNDNSRNSKPVRSIIEFAGYPETPVIKQFPGYYKGFFSIRSVCGKNTR